MSGATAAAQPSGWEKGAWHPPYKRYTCTPNVFFQRLFRVLTSVEMAVLGNVLAETIGAEGHPEWARISFKDFAVYADCHVNSVAKALELLAEIGAIEARPCPRDKRTKEYRTLWVNWSRLTATAAAKVRERMRAAEEQAAEEDDDEQETDDDIAAQAPQQSVMILVAGWKEPRPVHLCKACAHRVAEVASGKSLTEPTAMAKKKERLTDSKGEKWEIPTLECGHSAAAGNGHSALASQLIDFLESRLSGKVADSAPRELLSEQAHRLYEAGVPFDYFVKRWRIREKDAYSYGFAVKIADDCIASCERARKASEARSRATSSPSPPPVDVVTQYRRHLADCTAKLRSLDGYGEAIDSLASLMDAMPERINDFEALTLDLDVAEDVMLHIAETGLDKNTRARIDRAVAKKTKAYKGRLTLDGYEQTVRNVRRAEIFKEAGLPRLSP